MFHRSKSMMWSNSSDNRHNVMIPKISFWVSGLLKGLHSNIALVPQRYVQKTNLKGLTNRTSSLLAGNGTKAMLKYKVLLLRAWPCWLQNYFT